MAPLQNLMWIPHANLLAVCSMAVEKIGGPLAPYGLPAEPDQGSSVMGLIVKTVADVFAWYHANTFVDFDETADKERRRVRAMFLAEHGGKLVGGLEGIQHGRQACVEDAVQRQHGNTHGKNDINNGVIVNSPRRAAELIS